MTMNPLFAASLPLILPLIKESESLKLTAYLCPAGVPTIGYGHTGGVQLGDRITPARAEELLQTDLAEAAAIVDRAVTVPLTPGQYGALVSFVFNVGAGRAASGKDPGKDGFVQLRNGKPSTMRVKLNRGDFDGAAAEFGKWIKGGGRVLPGLVKRRQAERALFEGVSLAAATAEAPIAQAVEPVGPPPVAQSAPGRVAAGGLAVGGALTLVSELVTPALQVAQQAQQVADQVQVAQQQVAGVVDVWQGLLAKGPLVAAGVLAVALVATIMALVRERRATSL
ncbi:lysozyme (modular protein) (plasmid) [Azospirillum thermophilum]|uniref:Lysozyme n=2 Tax=Azospirillum thermophilum TaxID=2202148 RepID=A0A2S2D0Q4_9PROT|nr:lysozyme (modular protein) [Azospirillum thermophilum]